ncbi:MAG: NAD/NADP octopine/nopaline dehydrogenase family protein [Propionibacteriaceae bacterium]|jgi:hypothetical protein|nr:NAD/NADP octopine/nopaline dehydrogenase family protein [Propionibacteriaceae bacterium]
MTKVTVVGGGNIGLALCAYLDTSSGVESRLLTTHPGTFSVPIGYTDSATGDSWTFNIGKVTSDIGEALVGSDLVLMTLPSFSRIAFLDAALPHLRPGATVCSVPGYGGTELAGQRLSQVGVIFAGLDRVPAIARLTPGMVTASKKPSVRCAAIRGSDTARVASLLSSVLGLTVESLPNYLSVALTPSNPILHTSRLYSLFHNWTAGETWPANVAFYADWNDEASTLLLECDAELQAICRALPEMDLTGVIPLATHYDASTAEALTAKLRSIPSLHGILSPMRPVDAGFVPDLSSRYFGEDFPYGLCNLKGFAQIVDVPTPHMDRILTWYERVADKEYFTPGGLGPDAANTGIPQNWGISTVKDVYEFYNATCW